MAAIDYTDELAAGWIIFPLHTINRTASGVTCGCLDPACQAIGKHPRASNWQHTQPYDEEQLAYLEDFDGEYFGNQLIDNHGVVVASSGLLIVDVDGRNGGFASAERLQHIREQARYIVRTGSGNGEHWYFSIPSEWVGKALSSTLRDYPGIDFKSTGFVVGVGCEHASGQRYEAIKGSPADVTEAPLELMQLLERPERTRFVYNGTTTDYSNDDLRSMVAAIPNRGRDYERWIRIGMALHDATGGSRDGYDMWLEWSSRSDVHDESIMDKKWHSFGKAEVRTTVGTLIEWARENGWSAPVTFTDNTDWGELPDVTTAPEGPAPAAAGKQKYGGVVGALYEYIDSQCLFPREHIALAAALTAVSAAASLRFRADHRYQVPLNLMVLCIADSGTGKEAVYQGLIKAMDAAGLSGAVYGEVKSEQELYRNAIRNQASFYAIDECGALLGKIGGAKKSGGATYLQAVPAAIMKIFTKTNGYLQLGGDVKEELKKEIERDYARVQKKIDDGDADQRDHQRLEDLKEAMAAVKKGIKNPILSFFGITEPHSFDAAISQDTELMVNGFLGRALMFREHDPLPLRRDNYNPGPMPSSLAARLFDLYSGGHAGDDEKVQRHGDIITIPIEPDAEALLDEVYHYWRAQGQALAMDGQGIHSITTRVWEMVVKVSAVLSLPLELGAVGSITKEHVRQAHALVRKVTEYKIDHCKIAIGADSHDMDERSQGILSGVRSILDGMPDGVGAGIIRNRLRSYKNPEGVNKCLEWLQERGEVEAIEYVDVRNRKHIKYKKVLQHPQ